MTRATTKAERRDTDELRAKLDSIAVMRTRITAAGHPLIERAHAGDTEPDGYPTRASGADPAAGGCYHTDPDELDYSDPTGGAVIARQKQHPDKIAALARRLMRNVDDAHRALANACAVLDFVAHQDGQATPTADDRWCVNHMRHGRQEPTYRRRRMPDGGTENQCRACYEFFGVYRFPLPGWWIARAARGERANSTWTEKAVAEHRAKQPRPRRKGRRP